MQHKRINIGTEFGDNERHPVRHQTADEMHVATETVQLADDDRGRRACALLLWRLQVRVCGRAHQHLFPLSCSSNFAAILKPSIFAKALNRFALRVEAEATFVHRP